MEASRLTRVALWSSFFRAPPHVPPHTESYSGAATGVDGPGRHSNPSCNGWNPGGTELPVYAEWIAAIVSVVTSDSKKT